MYTKKSKQTKVRECLPFLFLFRVSKTHPNHGTKAERHYSYFACPNFFWYCKSFLVDVTFCYLDQEVKRISKKYGHICLGLFSLPTPFPTLAPTSVFPFFSILIVEENVCNTLRNKAVMVLIESLDHISKAIKDR